MQFSVICGVIFTVSDGFDPMTEDLLSSEVHEMGKDASLIFVEANASDVLRHRHREPAMHRVL